MSEAKNDERAAGLRRFKPYPVYRDSGVEWLGEIPAHWEVKPLKRALRPGGADGSLIKGRMHDEPAEGLFPGFSASGQDIWVEEAQHWTPGIVLSAVGARCGKTFKADGAWTAIANTHVIFPEAGYDRDFLWYLTNNEVFWDRGGTAQPFIRVSSTLQRSWCFSSPDEQRAIAAFLDRETARIDTLVAKKEQLIELLQEKRTALITRAVTKGLDPNVPMKDSGVEWLGEIPAHWEVTPLKHVADFINGFAFKPVEWGLEGTPIIRIENLNGGENFNCTTRELPARYCADKGDLLFGWSGNRGTSFGPFVWWREGKHYVNQHIFRFVDYDVDKLWLYWALRGVTFYVEKQAHGIIGMVHVTRGELGTIPIPVLPPSEQVEIARFLEREHARIDSIAERVREAIDRLKEFRTALISAAVTGKIDVREEAA